MHIRLNNDISVPCEIYQGIFQPVLNRWIKHLRHVDIPWRPWEHVSTKNFKDIDHWIDSLDTSAKILSIPIDKLRCREQQYLNYLHSIYEKSYDGNQAWLDFHENMHIVEAKLYGRIFPDILEMNFRQIGGMLQVKFDHEWTKHGRLSVTPGEIYLAWEELGKSPYQYWRDQEPDNLERFCELAKPWLHIRPKFHVALDAIDFGVGPSPEFESWFDRHKRDWCEHWNIPDWDLDTIFMVLPVGKVDRIQDLRSFLNSGIAPRRIED